VQEAQYPALQSDLEGALRYGGSKGKRVMGFVRAGVLPELWE